MAVQELDELRTEFTTPIHMFYREWAVIVEIERHPEMETYARSRPSGRSASSATCSDARDSASPSDTLSTASITRSRW
jgi:hypothetical protein